MNRRRCMWVKLKGDDGEKNNFGLKKMKNFRQLLSMGIHSQIDSWLFIIERKKIRIISGSVCLLGKK